MNYSKINILNHTILDICLQKNLQIFTGKLNQYFKNGFWKNYMCPAASVSLATFSFVKKPSKLP